MLVTTICPVCYKPFAIKQSRFSRVGKTQRTQPCCSRRCGALSRKGKSTLVHGQAKVGQATKEYRAWCAMKKRCLRESDKRYDRYGGRGITVCKRWVDSFETFFADVGSAPSPSHSLGRINNDGNYEPGNVEWQLIEEQANNKSTSRLITAFGKTQTLNQWAREKGFRSGSIATRIDDLGWEPERALSEQLEKRSRPSGKKRLVTFREETKTITDWSRTTGIKDATIACRLDKGWSVEKALTVDPETYKKRVAIWNKPKLK